MIHNSPAYFHAAKISRVLCWHARFLAEQFKTLCQFENRYIRDIGGALSAKTSSKKDVLEYSPVIVFVTPSHRNHIS
jgi:hypothetical protein